MVTISQIITSGFLLCVSVSNPLHAAEINSNECAEIKGGKRDLDKCEEDRRLGTETVKGQLLHVEEGKYVVQQFYGKEVQLNTDARTQVTGTIGLGDSIEAMVRNVNDEKLVLFIQQLKKTR